MFNVHLMFIIYQKIKYQIAFFSSFVCHEWEWQIQSGALFGNHDKIMNKWRLAMNMNVSRWNKFSWLVFQWKANWMPSSFSVSWLLSPDHSGWCPMTSIDFHLNSRGTYQSEASLDRKTISYWVFVNAFDSHMWPTNNNRTRIQTSFSDEVTKTIIHFILLYSVFIFSCVPLILSFLSFHFVNNNNNMNELKQSCTLMAIDYCWRSK